MVRLAYLLLLDETGPVQNASVEEMCKTSCIKNKVTQVRSTSVVVLEFRYLAF